MIYSMKCFRQVKTTVEIPLHGIHGFLRCQSQTYRSILYLVAQVLFKYR